MKELRDLKDSTIHDGQNTSQLSVQEYQSWEVNSELAGHSQTDVSPQL